MSKKTVFITGADKGIGFAAAKQFLINGYNVILSGRSEEILLKAKERLGGNAEYVIWDVSNIGYADKAITAAHSVFGKIDVFVNNAGVVCDDDIGESYKDFFEKTESGWDYTMNVNLKGMFFALQAEARYMRKYNICGNIVNLCSEMGFRPAEYAYGISKWGVRGMTMGVGKRLAEYGIVVNGIAPGETATEIIRQKEGEIKKIDSPRGIQASPEEIAEGIYFLANSRNIIGEILISDGGRNLH